MVGRPSSRFPQRGNLSFPFLFFPILSSFPLFPPSSHLFFFQESLWVMNISTHSCQESLVFLFNDLVLLATDFGDSLRLSRGSPLSHANVCFSLSNPLPPLTDPLSPSRSFPFLGWGQGAIPLPLLSRLRPLPRILLPLLLGEPPGKKA